MREEYKKYPDVRPKGSWIKSIYNDNKTRLSYEDDEGNSWIIIDEYNFGIHKNPDGVITLYSDTIDINKLENIIKQKLK